MRSGCARPLQHEAVELIGLNANPIELRIQKNEVLLDYGADNIAPSSMLDL